jgi:hypothetical protein
MIYRQISSETLSHLLSLFGLLWNGENSRLSSSEWLTPGRWGSVVQICCRGKDHRLYRIRLIVWRGAVASYLSKNSSVSAGCILLSINCVNRWEKVNNSERYSEKQTVKKDLTLTIFPLYSVYQVPAAQGDSNSCLPDLELGSLTKWLASWMLVWVSRQVSLHSSLQ